jgi:Skp family chaperone for outer membrane proteins
MPRIRRLLIDIPVITFMILATFLRCNNSSPQNADAKNNSNDTIKNTDTITTQYTKDMETYKKKMEDTISAIDKRIDALKAKFDQGGMEAKKEYKKAIADLDQKGKELKKKLDDYQETGKEKWEKFKADFSEDIDTLSKQLKDLTSGKPK